MSRCRDNIVGGLMCYTLSPFAFNRGLRLRLDSPLQFLGQTLGEVKIVADMHQRKSEMAKHADAFVALPGGYGTMKELLDMITWSQLGIHHKPVGLLNVEGYYNSLLALLDKVVEEGFIQGSARCILVSADSPRELLSRMEEYETVHERVATRQRWEVDQLSVSASQSGDTQILEASLKSDH